MTLLHVLLVGIGGFFGAISRFFINEFVKSKFQISFPIATTFVNLLGSFLIGLFFGFQLQAFPMLLLGTGFMGSFTTFSTFSFEGMQLFTQNKYKELFIYCFLHFVFGILLALTGFVIGNVLR